jgi:hypothetical protein
MTVSPITTPVITIKGISSIKDMDMVRMARTVLMKNIRAAG